MLFQVPDGVDMTIQIKTNRSVASVKLEAIVLSADNMMELRA